MQRQDGDDRHQGIAEHMADQDPPRPDTLGARGAHEVALRHVQHGGTGHAEHGRRQPDADRQRRHRQQQQMPPGIARQRHIAAGGHPTQRLSKHQHQHRPNHEDRHRQPDRGLQQRPSVQPPARPVRGQHTRRNPHHHGEQSRGQDQFQGARQATRDLSGDRRVVLQRPAEIALCHQAEPLDILHRQGPIQAELLPQFGHRRRVGRDAPL